MSAGQAAKVWPASHTLPPNSGPVSAPDYHSIAGSKGMLAGLLRPAAGMRACPDPYSCIHVQRCRREVLDTATHESVGGRLNALTKQCPDKGNP
eukprot:365574-Chlamydomonas_euryale.AAC.17